MMLTGSLLPTVIVIAAAVLMLAVIWPSIRIVGPTEVGLVTKRFGKGLPEGSPIALNGEAGYQADLLMPGWRWKLWITHSVEKHPWVQIPAGEIGVVVAQAGKPLPVGAKSAAYKQELGNFTDLRTFIQHGGEKGLQRPVLSPGSTLPMHPVGFMVITKKAVHGVPVSEDLLESTRNGKLSCTSFGLKPEQLDVVRIEPQKSEKAGKVLDIIGVVTAYEGKPLASGDIANRLGGFDDIEAMEKAQKGDAELVEAILGSKNDKHNNYQDFQAFLDTGGRIGLQHDPLLYGAYNLNPFLVSVELVPMLVVKQGEVGVIKAYVGLATQDTSGAGFKHGSLVRPGHRGIWQEPLRTGKYAINPRCYEAEIVQTSILTLNWADAVSQAHNLDHNLKQIVAKSSEGFVFNIDLQVQIHVPDTLAPKVISMVGTMANLVNEVLQAAVGNHFRDKLQSMSAVSFIETRQDIQRLAMDHIKTQLLEYHVETKGVYIQDVILPAELVEVLTQREIAKQNIKTFEQEKLAEEMRQQMEAAKGTANQQADLAKSQVGIQIASNEAEARKKTAEGEACFIRETGQAKGAEIESVGLARAKGFEAQKAALGESATALVNAINAIAEGRISIMPDVLVTGGSNGSIDGLAAVLTGVFGRKLALPDVSNAGSAAPSVAVEKTSA